MPSHFSSAFFAANRQKLRDRADTEAPVVVAANGLLQRGGDSSYPFSQDANFWYLTGIDEPDILLVLDKDSEYLIVPGRSGMREAFDGAVSADELSRRSGIKDVYDDKEGWARLEAALRKYKQAATVAPPPAYVEQYGLYTNPARAALQAQLEAAVSGLETGDVGQALARLRMVKQPAEVKAIQKAVDITAASLGVATTVNMLSNYQHEYELEAEIRAGFRKRGASGDAFEPIVAGGKNACTLHNVANNGQLQAKDLVLADVGAEVEHYAADITRVYSRAKPTPRQRAVYAAVLEAQEYAFGLLKPGVMPKEYEQQVEKFMGEKLRELKLIKTIDHQSVRKYYPHSTSHFLGLNVHDVGDYTQALQPGVVMTVEPGIYIPEESIGVRLEDDVLITARGAKMLSGKLPKGL